MNGVVLVGLRSPSLNQALRTYLAAGPPKLRRRQARTVSRPNKIALRLSEDDVAELVDGYESGLTAVQLAERHQVAKSTVLKLLGAAGVERRNRRFTAEEKTRAADLYRQGLPQVEIARKLGREPGAVWHVLRRAGLV